MRVQIQAYCFGLLLVVAACSAYSPSNLVSRQGKNQNSGQGESCIGVGDRCTPGYSGESCCLGTKCERGNGRYAPHICQEIAESPPPPTTTTPESTPSTFALILSTPVQTTTATTLAPTENANCIQVGERCSSWYSAGSCCPGTSCERGSGMYAPYLCAELTTTRAPQKTSTTTPVTTTTTVPVTTTTTVPVTTTTTVPVTTTTAVSVTKTTAVPVTTTTAVPVTTITTVPVTTTTTVPVTTTTTVPVTTETTVPVTTETTVPVTTTTAVSVTTRTAVSVTTTTAVPVTTTTALPVTTTTALPVTTTTALPVTTTTALPVTTTTALPVTTTTALPVTTTTAFPVTTTTIVPVTTTSTSTVPIGTSVSPGCVAGSTGGFTHGAHAVPGSYPPKINANSPKSYVDTDGNGFETVFISGDGSHTHIVDTTNPLDPKPGDVVSYKWTLEETGEVISNEVSFSYNFPVGVTTLHLEVEDTACDVSDAVTTVTVTGAISPGAYCYYYNSQELPPGEGLESDGNLRPFYATEYLKTFEGELETPPVSFGSDIFSARCFLLYETTEDSEVTALSVSTAGTGDAQIYKSSQLIGSSSEEALPAGLALIELQYLRTATAEPPQLSFLVNGTAVTLESMSYDRSLVLPVLTSISPNSGPATGGGNAVITGYGFYSKPFVKFGTADEVEASSTDITPNSFSVQIPQASANGPVSVTAASSPGGLSSNSLEYVYDSGVEPIKFAEKVLTQDGGTYQATFTTSIAYFDGSWYLGRIGGYIRKLTVSADLEVTATCDSPSLSDPKFSKDGLPAQIDILGIGFDPRDTVGRPYVTSGTIYFFMLRKIDTTNMDAHMNGRIDRFGPGGGCLVHEGQIASGLPMADHDHGPSGFDWDNDGTMYITSAGVTNGGLPGPLFGNMYETPLSAAILTLNPDAPGFNGAITYDKDYSDHKNAKVTGGDFSVYATGIRNSFDMVYTSKNELYASDNGPNIYRRGNADDYGRFSFACTDDLPTDGAPARSDPDKILRITRGAWYGHPNLNRGNAGAGAECQFINPLTNQNEASPPQNAPAGYTPPFFTVTSSVNGMAEYTAAHFNGAMKGDLLASTYSNRGYRNLYRIEVAPKQKRLSVLAKYGTLSVAMGVWGELLLPKYGGDFQVLEPDYTFPLTLSARTVKPFRGGAAGGLKVTVTGHNFGSNPTVTFNGKVCELSGSVVTTSRGDMVTCVTPPSGGGVNLVDVVVRNDEASSTISEGFMYMSV